MQDDGDEDDTSRILNFQRLQDVGDRLIYIAEAVLINICNYKLSHLEVWAFI